MKSLIICNSEKIEWSEVIDDNINPYLLKLANKPIIDYYIDFLYSLGVTKVRIYDNKFITQIREHLENRDVYDISISYGISNPNDTVKKALAKNNSFIKEDEVLVIDKIMIPIFREEVEEDISETTGLFFLNQGSTHLKNRIRCFQITSLKDYFELSTETLPTIIKRSSIPGYKIRENQYVGTMSNISESSYLSSLIVLGDFVKIEENVRIEGPTYVGNNSIICKNAQIKKSILLDNVFVSENIYIKNKIITSDNIIDPYKNESIHISDYQIVGDASPKIITPLVSYLYSSVISILLLIFISPATLILFPFLWKKSLLVRKQYYDKKRKKMDLITIEKESNILSKLAAKICVDKFFLLIGVIKNRVSLIGISPMEYEKQNQGPFSGYWPGAFHAHSTGETDPQYLKIHSLYFKKNKGFLFDLKSLCKIS
jgi:NDP-sugar pyrophosphorylase family protein